VATNLVPNGPGYADAAHQACTGVGGALPGNTFVTGEQYLGSLSYSSSNIWRNFGIIWAFWFLFVVLTIIATSNWKASGGKSGFLLVPREKAKTSKHNLSNDEESQAVQEKAAVNSSNTSSSDDTKVDDQLIRNTSVFTWKNLSYTVKTPSGDRVLLDNVQGWVKPGMLGALMGSSGAGKTT
jgi:ABC-type transport system involved in cytochrome bd biosynthesis fused ATPase/permease subunit